MHIKITRNRGYACSLVTHTFFEKGIIKKKPNNQNRITFILPSVGRIKRLVRIQGTVFYRELIFYVFFFFPKSEWELPGLLETDLIVKAF